MCFISLHTPPQNFMARGATTPKILMSLRSLILLSHLFLQQRSPIFAVMFSSQPLLKMTCPLARTYLIQYLATPQNGSPFGFVITMQLLIITTAVRQRACLGCLGDSPRSPLNHCMYHQTLYPTCPSYPCTWLCKFWWPIMSWWQRY
jgi:hypothetical protein